MTAPPFSRPPARQAGPELLVLAHWEEFLGWLLAHTSRWPKSARFTLCQRVQNAALDVAELLVVARYEPRARPRTLRRVNLTLERMRLVLRVALGATVMPPPAFETAMRGLDETGRMLHGWRQTLEAQRERRRRGGELRGSREHSPDLRPPAALRTTADSDLGASRP